VLLLPRLYHPDQDTVSSPPAASSVSVGISVGVTTTSVSVGINVGVTISSVTTCIPVSVSFVSAPVAVSVSTLPLVAVTIVSALSYPPPHFLHVNTQCSDVASIYPRGTLRSCDALAVGSIGVLDTEPEDPDLVVSTPELEEEEEEGEHASSVSVLDDFRDDGCGGRDILGGFFCVMEIVWSHSLVVVDVDVDGPVVVLGEGEVESCKLRLRERGPWLGRWTSFSSEGSPFPLSEESFGIADVVAARSTVGMA